MDKKTRTETVMDDGLKLYLRSVDARLAALDSKLDANQTKLESKISDIAGYKNQMIGKTAVLSFVGGVLIQAGIALGVAYFRYHG